MMWGYGWSWPTGLWMLLGGLFWLLVLGLLVWALVRWLDGRGATDNQPSVRSPSALDILRERYARGEMDTATFERMSTQLNGTQRPMSVPSDTAEPTLTRG